MRMGPYRWWWRTPRRHGVFELHFCIEQGRTFYCLLNGTRNANSALLMFEILDSGQRLVVR